MDEETYFQNLVSNSLDGTLTELEREKLTAHLQECQACAALKQDLEQMRTAFLADTTEENENSALFPPDLHRKIMQRVEQEQRLTVVRPEKPVRRMPVFTMVAMAAIVVLMVLGGGLGDLFSMTDTGDRTASGISSSDAGEDTIRAARGGNNMEETTEENSKEPSVASAENENTDNNNTDAIAGKNNMAAPSDNHAEKSADSPVTFSDTTTGTTDTEGNAAEEDIALAQANDTPAVEQDSPDVPSDTMPEAAYNLDEMAKQSHPSVSENDTGTDNALSETEENVSTEERAYKQEEMPIITLPDSLLGHAVAHCYLAWGASGLPDLTKNLNVLLTANGISYFSLPNEMNTMAETLDAMEQAGYQVDVYESVGLEIDKKADTWLLIVAESQ